MKVLLIGTGAVGHVLSKLLARDKNISKIICATNDTKSAKKFVDTKNKKIKLVKLDASIPDDVIRVSKDVDVIINASLPDYNEAIMQAALKVKADYLDLCSYLKDHKTAEQLKYHRRFKKSRLTALINAGVAPGITNLLARDIADKLDTLDSLKIRLLEDQKASEFVPSWSVQVILDELGARPIKFSNGKLRFLKPFEDFEEYEFHHPHGKRIAVNLFGDEIATIPKYIKARNIDFKSSGSDIEFSRALYRMGLLSSKPIEVNDSKIVPLEFFTRIVPGVPTPEQMKFLIKNKVIENSIFISAVEGVGEEKGISLRIKKTVAYPDLLRIQKIMPGATYISYPTGIAAYSFLKVLPKIKKHGVFPPEALEQHIRDEVLLELENHGIVVNEQSSKL